MAKTTKALTAILGVVAVLGTPSPSFAGHIRVPVQLMNYAGLSPAAVQKAGAPMTIFVHAGNAAGVPAVVLERAKEVVSSRYREIGIEIRWEFDENAAAEGPGRRLFLMIVPPKMASGMAVSPIAMGVAVTSSKSRGSLAYIFYGRVAQVAAWSGADLAEVLGEAMAHEMGHLLLPAGHSATGLMRADWTQEDLQEASRILRFTEEQGARIRTRLMAALTRP